MLTHIRQRNRDLMKAIRREMTNTPPGTPLLSVIERAVNSPAPRFYVSFDTALKAVSRTLSGNSACGDPRKLHQWHELSALVATLTKQHPMPLTEAVARVLTSSEAPSFFISPSRALAIYHEQQRLSATLRTCMGHESRLTA